MSELDSSFPKSEKLFLLLAGIFISAMTMLNILGITKFIQMGPMALAVGVLPYPITFLDHLPGLNNLGKADLSIFFFF